MSDLRFTVIDAAPARRAATPAVEFRMRVETAGDPIEALMLHADVRVEPQWRAYEATTQTLLEDLFGTPDRWDKTLRALTWAEVPVMVRAFDEETEFTLRVPCTYEFESAVTQFFAAVDDGTIDVRMLFSGSMFRRSPEGFSAEMVPWSCESAYRMPASLWQDAMRACIGDDVLLRIDRATFDRLNALRASLGTTSWNATLGALFPCHGEPVEP